jgi:hypothetical protein
MYRCMLPVLEAGAACWSRASTSTAWLSCELLTWLRSFFSSFSVKNLIIQSRGELIIGLSARGVCQPRKDFGYGGLQHFQSSERKAEMGGIAYELHRFSVLEVASWSVVGAEFFECNTPKRQLSCHFFVIPSIIIIRSQQAQELMALETVSSNFQLPGKTSL